MWGMLIFDMVSSDVVYYDMDSAYHDYLVDLAVKRHLLSATSARSCGPNDDDWMNALMQIFSSLVQSQSVMQANFKNTYKSARLDGGTQLVFHIYDKFLFINTRRKQTDVGDEVVDESFERRMALELIVLHKIVHFLHGPAFQKLKPIVVGNRVDEWRRIQGIFQAWWTLYELETSFLTLSTEHLNFNEFTMRKIEQVLRMSVGELERIGDKKVTHAFLISGAKIISHYVSSLGLGYDAVGSAGAGIGPARFNRDMEALRLGMKQTIQPHDVLLILALIQYYYGTGDVGDIIRGDLIKFTAKRNSASSEGRSTFESDVETFCDDDEDDDVLTEEFYDTDADVGAVHFDDVGVARFEKSSATDGAASGSGGSEEVYHSSKDEDSGEDPDPETQKFLSTFAPNEFPSRITLDVGAKRCPLDVSSIRDGPEFADSLDIITWTIFLTFAGDAFHPHKIHLVPIHQGIVLVILTALGTRAHYSALNRCLKLFQQLLNVNDKNYQPPTLPKLEAAVKGCAQVMRQVKLSSDSILNLWGRIKDKGKLQTYLENATKPRSPSGCSRFPPRRSLSKSEEPAIMSPLLENLLSSFVEKVKSGLMHYKDLRNDRLPSEEKYANKLYAMQKFHLMPMLHDFKEFLQIKSWQNTTGSHYIELYPGLVHFIFVDRLTNHLVAPSLDLATPVTDDNKKDNVDKLKAIIWSKFEWCRQQLQCGFRTLTLVEDPFQFSYFVVSGHVSEALPSSSPATRTPTLLSPIAVTPISVNVDETRHSVMSHPQDFFLSVLKSTLAPSVTVPSSSNALTGADVVCVELFAVHLDDVPRSVIFRHASALLDELRARE